MQKIVIIIGLPGSGKTTYIQQHANEFRDYLICDDYHKSPSRGPHAFQESVYFEELKKALLLGKSVVMSDIAWCRSDRLKHVLNELKDFITELGVIPTIDFVYFENNPELCKKNVLYRNRPDRTEREFSFIDTVSQEYIIPNDITPIVVVDTSTK